MINVDELAQEIRRVDGNHDKGAGALAEALLPFLTAALPAMPAEQEIDEGRFEEWTLADFAGQCRMQARENLDPEYSQFMAALAAWLSEFAAMPGPAVKVPTGKAYRDLMDTAIAAYEANTPPSYRYSAIALTKAVEAAISALTPAPDLASENERLRAALEWYGEQAAATFRLKAIPDALMAIVVALSLDGGKRAKAALERT